MEPEGDLPPPYSEVDPRSNITTDPPLTSPSRISLRGGYLRGVAFRDDPSAALYFEERAHAFNQDMPLVVVDRDITAETVREDLPFPGFESSRAVTEQDWQTFVNYLLTELGNETSHDKNHKKALTAEEFYQRQSKIEGLIAEWNEGFFQPRSIKIIPHFYFQRRKSPTPTYRTLPEDQGSSTHMNSPLANPYIPHINANFGGFMGQHQHFGHAPLGHHSGPFRAGYNGHPFGGPFRQGPGFGRGRNGVRHGMIHHHHHMDHDRRWGPREDTRHQNREHRGSRGRRRHDSETSSESSESESESDDSDMHGRGGWRGRGGRGNRRHRGERNESRNRSSSCSSESSFSSLSSVSSGELNEGNVDRLREAIATFRLDTTNTQQNKIAFKELKRKIREQRKEAKRNDGCKSFTKAETRAIKKELKNDLKGLRKEAKAYQKAKKEQRKAAKKEAKAAKKDGKNARKYQSDRDQFNGQENASTRSNTFISPSESDSSHRSDIGALRMEQEAQRLENEADRVVREGEKNCRGINHPEKRKIAMASHEQAAQSLRQEANRIRSQIEVTRNAASYHTISPTSPGFATRAANLGEDFGRRMEIWGEQFGRSMERWGEDFGRRMEAKGKDIERKFS
jgi:hypothetical protein